MTRSINRVFIATLLLAIPATAGASPTSFNGTYNLTCESATYTLHFDLLGQLGGTSVSYHPPPLQVAIPCSGDDPAIASLLAGVEQRCLAAGLGDLCDDVVGAVASSIDNTIALVPQRITATITNAGDWFAQLLQIFNVHVRHVFGDGAIRYGSYLLSDRNDSSNGDLVSLSLAVDGVATAGAAGCVATSLGAVQGKIARHAGFSLTGKVDLDRSLTCGFAYNGSWLAGMIGLTFHADVSGAKAQP